MNQIAQPTEDIPMLPSTFKVIRKGRSIFVVRTGFEDDMLRERDESEGQDYGRGRGPIRSYPLGEKGERMLVRHGRRGGFFGLIARDLFWGTRRAVREIAVAERAAEKGVATALVLGARCERAWGPFYRMEVVTHEIANSCDLIRYVELKQNASAYPAQKNVIPAVGRAVRRMHDAGIFHADLHLKNILIDSDGEVYIIDMDSARAYPSLGIRARTANLLRLDRSTRKWKAARESVTTADRLRFLKAYAGDEPDMTGVCLQLFRRKATYGFHRFFWKLMGIEQH